MEEEIRNRIKRFKHCTGKFYPYIESVLKRLPEEVCFKGILDDSSLEIVSLDETALGQFYHTTNHATSLIVLNERLLKYPETQVIYTIVHELAHKVAREGRTGLLEKEAEELLRAWGFGKESEAMDYHNPILESAGYEAGYKWAQRAGDGTLEPFEEFYHEWNESRLSPERLDLLFYATDVTSILIAAEEDKEKDDLPKDTKVYMDTDGRLGYGVVWGIMGYMKEKKERKERKERLKTYPIRDVKTIFINILEKVYYDCMKLCDLKKDRMPIVCIFGKQYPKVKPFFDSLGALEESLRKMKEHEQKGGEKEQQQERTVLC